MKVKIKNKIYDADKEPIMIILSEQDKINIAGMDKEHTKYCVYPTETSKEYLKEFMEF